MLQKLHIQNYAIIESIQIEFSKQLNIITGETGAGKSILMGALNLILGERADINALLDKEKKMFVEAYFSVKGNASIKAFLGSNELDFDDDLVVRREIAANGKSRAFINDTPVNLTQLKALGRLLVDLHQQFDTLELGDNNFQRQVLDAIAGNLDLLKEYEIVFGNYLAAKKEGEALLLQQRNVKAALDYNQFLFNELDEAKLKDNELEDLEYELKLLTNAEQIKLQLTGIYFELAENEQPVVQQLKLLANSLHGLLQYHKDIEETGRRLQSVQLELSDIADEINRISNSIQYSPEKIQIMNDRLSMGYKLLKKHQVQTTGELIAIKATLQEKLDSSLQLDEAIEKNQQVIALVLAQCQQLASIISTNRHKVSSAFQQKVNSLLMKVGMPNARFEILLTKVPLSASGTDSLEFLFDANKSGRLEQLRRVASGGELSRIMLCIKSLVAQKLQLPTLIFDEIDTGISGEAAKQVGEIMQSLSTAHQVISITHQPQIAAKATAHYFVYKEKQGNKIATSIRLLNKEERITTIAQMLSGEKPTAAAVENAREMVSN